MFPHPSPTPLNGPALPLSLPLGRGEGGGGLLVRFLGVVLVPLGNIHIRSSRGRARGSPATVDMGTCPPSGAGRYPCRMAPFPNCRRCDPASFGCGCLLAADLRPHQPGLRALRPHLVEEVPVLGIVQGLVLEADVVLAVAAATPVALVSALQLRELRTRPPRERKESMKRSAGSQPTPRARICSSPSCGQPAASRKPAARPSIKPSALAALMQSAITCSTSGNEAWGDRKDP